MRVARRISTDQALRARTTGLPPELLQDASRRLAIACLVWASLWTVALVMNDLVAPRLERGQPLDDAWPMPGTPAAVLSILLSIGLFAYSRRRGVDPRRLLDLALVYEVLIAFAIGVVNQWTPNLYAPSWICVLVVVNPLIAPNTPRRTFVASMTAASMDLVGLGLSAMRGVELPTPAEIVWANLGTYLCAGLAVLAASTITKLGRQVNEARELGSYQLGDLLGEGGMASVYRATHRMLARPAAIKLVRPDVLGAGNPDQARRLLQRFEREAQATALLTCPHTIHLYDFGVSDDGTFYYVMELLDGFDLDTFVTRFGPAEPARAVRFLRQVCQSLAEAHERNLIHRDVKPANVYVCRYGREVDFIKVLDFGLVKAERELAGTDVSVTIAHAPGGTPAFMAPEQILGKGPVDHRSDIYAVRPLPPGRRSPSRKRSTA
jgi:hypothetical protein